MQIIKVGTTPPPLSKADMAAQQANQLPSEWVTSTYAPGFPIQPITTRKEVEVPREIDYPISVNATLQPRTGYGLMPFAALAEAYETITEVQMPVHVAIRELSGFRPRLIDSDGNEVMDHDMSWLTVSPDRINPFDVWLARFLQSKQVFDAGAFFVEMAHDNLQALRYIDGSTLFVMVDEHGEIPTPQQISADPEVRKRYFEKANAWLAKGKALPASTPAYCQVIKGTPFGWYDQNQISYRPSFRRYNSPYGKTAIEEAWAWVLIIANITGFELAHYREGNMPEGWAELPVEFFPNLERIAVFETAFNNRMTSGPAERMRTRFFPAGTKWHETKKAEFPEKLYERCRDNIALSFGVPASEFGKVPGSGLGGKGFAEAMQSALFRMCLLPNKTYVENGINEILKRVGVTDVTFELALPTQSVDPEKQKEATVKLFAAGVLTLNDALGELGKEPVEGGDIHIVVANGAVIVLEDYLKGKRDAGGEPGADVAGEEAPVPASSVPGDDQPQTEEDYEIAEKMLKNSKISETTYSLPIKAAAAPALPAGVSVEAFRTGLQEETFEHPTIAPDIIHQLVIDHLKENPDYYKAGGHIRGAIAVTNAESIQYRKYMQREKESYEANEAALAKVDLTHSDGSMVAVFIPADVAGQLRAIADGLGLPADAEMETADQMHVTLAFLPDDQQVQANREKIISAVQAACLGRDALHGNVQGYGVFNGKGGKHVLYATLDIYELPFIRTAICEKLDEHGVSYAKDHGFVPHITLAYFPDAWQLPEGFMVPDIDTTITGVTLAIGPELLTVPLTTGQDAAPRVGKVDEPGDLQKHCGVCVEDDEYYGAPIIRQGTLTFPDSNHANGVEIVVMAPAGLPSKPALWKPEGNELEVLQYRIGGPQYPREEAAYLLDRSLGFYLVPVAYVAEVDDEKGAALYYTFGAGPSRELDEYAPFWVERAAVLDFVAGQTDRHVGNWLTHPDDAGRPVMIDNGLAFPVEDLHCISPFCEAMIGKPLETAVMAALRMCLADTSTWADIRRLVGPVAAQRALACVAELLSGGMIVYSEPEANEAPTAQVSNQPEPEQ